MKARVHDLLLHMRGSLLRNSLFMMIRTVATSALGFLYWLLAARLFDAGDVGLAAALVSAMTFASTLSNPGLQSVLVQLLPGRASGREWASTLNAALLLGTITGVVAGLACVALLPFVSMDFNSLATPAGVSAFVLGVVFTTLANLFDFTWIAERQAGKAMLRNILFAAGKLPLLALPVVVALGAEGIFGSWVISVIATVALAFVVLPRLGRGYYPTLAGFRGHVREFAPLLAGHHMINLGNLAPMALLPVLVTGQISAESTAYFYATFRLAGIFFMVAPSVATALFAEGSHDAGSLAQQTRSGWRFILLLLVPTVIVLAVLGKPILAMFGPAYAEQGYGLLLLFALAALPDAVTNVYSTVLRVQGRLVFAGAYNVVLAVATLGIAAVAMPKMGIAGAGLAWLIARAGGSVVAAWDWARVRGVQIERLRRSLPNT